MLTRPRTRSILFLVAALGLGFAAGALAADADLQQYNRPAANAESANGSDALTGSLLLVRDGKRITADSNGAGSAPVNRSMKQVADALAGVRCGTWGNCTGVNPRTLRSLHVDGTGGAASGLASGVIKGAGVIGTQYLEAQIAGTGTHSILGNLGLLDVTGGGKFRWRDRGVALEGTAASGANPASTVALQNELRAVNIPKAWGYVTTDGIGGAPVVEDGANISAVSRPGGTDIRVTYASGFDNANYAVMGMCAANGTPVHCKAFARSTTYTTWILVGTDCTAVLCELNFVAFGRQTTP